MQYGTTHADLSATPPETAWRMLRSLRHQPPGRAKSGDRKATFDAALEQSEQFMSAARVAGVATRPVLAFYALTQAAWAVNAVSTARNGQDWRLPGGHGITARNLSTMTGSLASLSLQDTGKGSFTTIAETLRAASLPDETPLGDLWCLLPDSERFPLPEQGNARLLSVASEATYVLRGERTPAILQNLPGHLIKTDPNDSATPDWGPQREATKAILMQYPTLKDADFVAPPGQSVGLQWLGGDSLLLRVLLGKSGNQADEAADLSGRGHMWCGLRLVYPRVGGGDKPAHPFMLWWAVLYGLSQLARYEPKVWLARTAIASSSDASPIEHLLDQAFVALPELIHRTIMEASQENSAE